MVASVYSRALEKAAELLGGQDKLARYLRTLPGELQKWIADEAKPPLGTFLRVVDIIIDETQPPAASDAADPPAPRECSAGYGSRNF